MIIPTPGAESFKLVLICFIISISSLRKGSFASYLEMFYFLIFTVLPLLFVIFPPYSLRI